MEDQYKTLEYPAEGLYKEKGSKFIAWALPVESSDEVRRQIDRLKRQYHDARHHCYAYRLGEGPYDTRYNDDGEPSGTAGKPIYGQILSFDLTNVMIMVIRYFGGVKLGTGGLIQAYRFAARDAIANGNIITKNWTITLKVSFPYTRMNEVMHTIKDAHVHIIQQEFRLKPTISLEIRKGKKEELFQKLISIEAVEAVVI